MLWRENRDNHNTPPFERYLNICSTHILRPSTYRLSYCADNVIISNFFRSWQSPASKWRQLNTINGECMSSKRYRGRSRVSYLLMLNINRNQSPAKSTTPLIISPATIALLQKQCFPILILRNTDQLHIKFQAVFEFFFGIMYPHTY